MRVLLEIEGMGRVSEGSVGNTGYGRFNSSFFSGGKEGRRARLLVDTIMIKETVRLLPLSHSSHHFQAQ